VSGPTAAPADRAAAVREALRRLVAERGFHGTSMSAVATEAGVAAGTAYVHYRSKDELVIAAYLEVKRELGLVAARAVGAASRSGDGEAGDGGSDAGDGDGNAGAAAGAGSAAGDGEPGWRSGLELEPAAAFRAMWLAIHGHLAENRDHARFLEQVEASPYALIAHERFLDVVDDPLLQALEGTSIGRHLVALPLPVLYVLALGPAVRLAAAEATLPPKQLALVAESCWRAVSTSP